MTLPTPQDFLDSLSGHVERGRTSSADRPICLAKVDPAYTPFAGYPDPAPKARVTFEGEDTLSEKAYPLASGFIPRAGQRVYLLPQGAGYVIAGAVDGVTAQGFWQSPDGTEAGVELGQGNYWDSTEGLYLEGDATIQGEVSAALARGWVAGQTFATARTTAATTELVVDYLNVTLDPSRRYELRWMTVAQGTIALDAFAVRFRYLAGAGALTAAGSQFMRLDINGAALAVPHHYVWPLPTLSGPYAVGATVQRIGGTGTWSANTAGTGRSLEIHDVGRA